jgi:hypothetical protein
MYDIVIMPDLIFTPQLHYKTVKYNTNMAIVSLTSYNKLKTDFHCIFYGKYQQCKQNKRF